MASFVASNIPISCFRVKFKWPFKANAVNSAPQAELNFADINSASADGVLTSSGTLGRHFLSHAKSGKGDWDVYKVPLCATLACFLLRC